MFNEADLSTRDVSHGVHFVATTTATITTLISFPQKTILRSPNHTENPSSCVLDLSLRSNHEWDVRVGAAGNKKATFSNGKDLAASIDRRSFLWVLLQNPYYLGLN